MITIIHPNGKKMVFKDATRVEPWGNPADIQWILIKNDTNNYALLQASSGFVVVFHHPQKARKP